LCLVWVQSAVLLGLACVACRFSKPAIVRQWVCRASLVGVAALVLIGPLGALRSKPIAALPF